MGQYYRSSLDLVEESFQLRLVHIFHPLVARSPFLNFHPTFPFSPTVIINTSTSHSNLITRLLINCHWSWRSPQRVIAWTGLGGPCLARVKFWCENLVEKVHFAASRSSSSIPLANSSQSFDYTHYFSITSWQSLPQSGGDGSVTETQFTDSN